MSSHSSDNSNLIVGIIGLIIAVLACVVAVTVPEVRRFLGFDDAKTAGNTIESNKNVDWVICWHGKFGYEFLVAYPSADIQGGIELRNQITNHPWDNAVDDLTDDSLKQCSVSGIWYGNSNAPWFPRVSYLRLENDSILVCENAGCDGQKWRMSPGSNPPVKIQTLIHQPTGNRIQLLNYLPSDEIR